MSYARSLLEYQMVRYLVAGCTAAATNITLLYVFTEYAHIWYLLSSIISLGLAWVVSFVLQKYWTFGNYGHERVHIQIPQHVALSVIGLGANTLMLYFLVEYAHIWYIAAQIVAGVVIACMNYLAYKRFIFPEPKAEA